MAASLMVLSETEDEEESQLEWTEFCKDQCKKLAKDFAKSWKQYQSKKLITIDNSDVISKVAEIFSSILKEELSFPHSLSEDKVEDLLNDSNLSVPNASPLEDSIEAISDDCSLESPSLKVPQRMFFRKISFRSLRKGKGFFFKQHSDEVELSPRREMQSCRLKLRNIKLSAECLKEGTIHLLAGDCMDGQLEWLKCRMVLVKLGAGHVIEFYYPPKSLKSRNGVFCSSIKEVRETTEIEMPDLRNTFVIKADNSKELVVEAKDDEDMKDWLRTIISYCSSNLAPGMTQSASADFLNNHLSNVKEETTVNLLNHPSHVPRPLSYADSSLPPRLANYGNSSTGLMLGEEVSGNSDIPENLPNLRPWSEPNDCYTQLRNYPWFHGMMSRSDASSAVLQDGYDGHGNFLVRQSETRNGEYVLTFNYQARAKHLRLTISPDGVCRVQHMSFTSIFDLLEYFRENHIPLVSGGASDVLLADFVINEELGDETHMLLVGGSVERRMLSAPVVRQYLSHGGSVRVTRRTLERQQHEISASAPPTGRAVENTYTYT